MAERNSNSTLAVLFAGVLLAALDIAIVGPALPAIRQTFLLDGRDLSWVFNIYILFSLISTPLMAKLSDRHGRRTVYTGCLGAFAAGSLIVGAAPTFEVLLMGRVVQACGAGGLLPVAAAVIADTFPPERRGRALGLIGAVFGIAFVLGPVLGGLLLGFGWRWLFLINVPAVAVVIAASLRLLPRAGRASRAPFDWPGALVLTVMLAGLAWGLGQLDADQPAASLLSLGSLPFVVALLLAALVFWRVELRSADPVLHPDLFRSPQLRVVGAIAVAIGLVEASMVFLPSFSVSAFDVSESTASFMMLPLVATLIVGAPAAGRLLDRIGAKPVIQLGLLLTVTGLFLFALLPLTRLNFYGAGVCVGFGLSGLLGAPLRYVALKEAGPERKGAGQGLLTLFLSTGRIVGASVIGGVVASGANELSGYREALLYLAIIGAFAFGISFRLDRSTRRRVRSRA
ncbi:MFS transporter [Candidatus Rariloculus sp.]|uniref:MFS transporter n=1 Tax=Candidatus Rariloculus sp. TaxID=3101265 RepID=UPI003D0F49B2